MCPECEGYSETIKIERPYEYFHLVRQIEKLVEGNQFSIIKATCKLSELQSDSVWPSDVVEHQFSCCNCGQQFSLVVDTYHGSGGNWKSIA